MTKTTIEMTKTTDDNEDDKDYKRDDEDDKDANKADDEDDGKDVKDKVNTAPSHQLKDDHTTSQKLDYFMVLNICRLEN